MSENIETTNQETNKTSTLDQIKPNLKYIISGLILVFIAFFSFSAVFSQHKPKSVLESFMKAMENQNYVKAYTLLSLPKGENNVISEEYFVNAMKNMDAKYGKIKDYRFDPVGTIEMTNETLERNGDVSYRAVMGRNDRHELTLTLHNESTGKKADWRVIANDFYTEYKFKVPNPSGLKISTDGVTLAVGVKNTLTFRAFKDANTKLVFESPDIKAKTFVLPEQEKELRDLSSFEANDALKKQLEEAVTGYFEAKSKASQDYDISHFVPYLKQDHVWNEFESTYESHKESGYKDLYSASDFKFSGVSVDSTKEGLTNATILVTHREFSKLIQGQGSDRDYISTEAFTFEKQPDGKWLIDWILYGQ